PGGVTPGGVAPMPAGGPAAAGGPATPAGAGGRTRAPRCRAPSTVPTGLRLVEVPGRVAQAPLGLIRDRRSGTWAAVLPVRGSAFALLDDDDKQRRLAAWGAILAGLARSRSPVVRMQWVERSVAGGGDGVRRYLREAGEGAGEALGAPAHAAAGAPATAARDSYQQLVDSAVPATHEHRVLLVIVVGRPPVRWSGGERHLSALDVARREIRLLQGRLRQAELSAGEPLSTAQLEAAIAVAVGGLPAGSRTGGTGWAMASDEAWAALRADGCWHATYWVAAWPRLDVPADFLAPLLLVGGVRAVSVTMAPVAPEKAVRQVESARTADLADDELRRRAGFIETARRRRQSEGVVQREVELADGHAEYRFSGYVTVTGIDRAELEASCTEVEQAAEAAHLQLRRLYGQQAEAFTWTLPLGRGLT
ncbi:MAG: SCO6880 family protein, partial [Acidimicrobiales bacterium]